MPQRLRLLHGRLGELIADASARRGGGGGVVFQPEREHGPGYRPGPRRGLLAAAQADLPVFEYTPLQVKDAVVGYGRATKDQVQQMVRVAAQS